MSNIDLESKNTSNKNAMLELIFDKFITKKKVIVKNELYSKYNSEYQYYCPRCKNILIKQLCKKSKKPKYCYECGQALEFINDKE